MPQWCGFAVNLDQQKNTLPSFWSTALTKADKWGFNVHRVPFIFAAEPSYGFVPTTPAQMDQILTLIDQHGAKAVLDYHCLNQTGPNNPKLGSQALIDAWKSLVTLRKNDPRIVAWEIANEPTQADVITGVTALSTQMMPLFANLIDAIRAIDPARPIIYPPSYFWGDPGIASMSSLTQYLRPNCYLSIHPYDYPYSYDTDNNPSTPSVTVKYTTWDTPDQYGHYLKEIANFRISKANSYIPYFTGIWCGEFEGHSSATNVTTQAGKALETQYVAYMINYFLSKQWGFNYWKYGNSVDDGQLDPDTVIVASGYTPTNTVLHNLTVQSTPPVTWSVNGVNKVQGTYSYPEGTTITLGVPNKVIA
jgi:hypothetical protein